jgi:cephalosporin hydroxylase
LFFATICDLVGHGQVVTIDDKKHDGRPEHPRITYVKGKAIDDEVAARVREIVGTPPNALVVLGSREPRGKVLKEFNQLSPLVPVGGYVVLEDTILNGHPVWPSFGPGPAEVVKNIVNTRGDFAPDPMMERYGVTFNPNGFLKRLS